MSVKGAFRKIWHGIKVAEPYLSLAGQLLAPGPVGLVLQMLDEVINRAEDAFPAQGSGAQKAEFFTLQALQLLEIATGKNADNPQTRALVGEIGTVTVEIKNLETQIRALRDRYVGLAKQVQAAIESAKAPAIDDAP